jgi:hypothetical protein
MNFNLFSSQKPFNNIDIYISAAVAFENGAPFDRCASSWLTASGKGDLPSLAITALKGFSS